jgi:hypothetical protein
MASVLTSVVSEGSAAFQLVVEIHRSVSGLLDLSVGPVVVGLFVMRRFSRRVQSVSQHAQNGASLSDRFFIDKPDHVFGTRRRSHTTHVFIVGERRRVGILVLTVNELHHVQ